MLPIRFSWNYDPCEPAPALLAFRSAADLPADGPLVFDGNGKLEISAGAAYGFDTYWLREPGLGKLRADLGVALEVGARADVEVAISASFRVEICRDVEGWFRCRLHRGSSTAATFQPSLRVNVQPQIPKDTPAAREPLARRLLEILTSAESNGAGQGSILRLRDWIYAKVRPALERKYSAEVGYCWQAAGEQSVLVDMSFAFTAQGLEAFQRLAGGAPLDLDQIDSRHVRLRSGAFTDHIRREARVELHLPFLGRRDWKRLNEAVARLDVSCGEDGRLLVYGVEASDLAGKHGYQSVLALAAGFAPGVKEKSHFSLTYSDDRILPAAAAAQAIQPLAAAYLLPPAAVDWARAATAPVTTHFTLSLDGCAAARWLDAPGERDPRFLETYSRVSVGIQAALRRWLPYVYFSDVKHYGDLNAAFPLVVYQATRPYLGIVRSALTYDYLNPDTLAIAWRSAALHLPAELTRIHNLLAASDMTRTAEFYAPECAGRILQSVQQQSRLFASLLIGDSIFIDALIRLASGGQELRRLEQSNPQKALRNLSRFAAAFVKTFHGRLRRLYGGREFVAFGPLLLVEATKALSLAQGQDIPVAATLRLSALDKECTFVNPHYIPPPG